MKRMHFIALSVSLIFISGVWAQDTESDFLYAFLQGTYRAIGKWPDTNRMYHGQVVFKNKGDHIQVIRSISGEVIEGVGRIATATADKIKVLRVQFSHGGRSMEATYLIHSDLDNYARLTGHLYFKAGPTRTPGLEALFIDRKPFLKEAQ